MLGLRYFSKTPLGFSKLGIFKSCWYINYTANRDV